MKRISITCLLILAGFLCEAQIFKDTLYWATPAEREMYRNAIKKGRSQKAIGWLVIAGGTGLTAVGGRLALAGIIGQMNDVDDTTPWEEDEYDRHRLLWKGGSFLFLAGAGIVGTGIDMIKDGRKNVRSAKVCFRLNATSAGFVFNF